MKNKQLNRKYPLVGVFILMSWILQIEKPYAQDLEISSPDVNSTTDVPINYFKYVATLRVSLSIISGYLGHEPTPEDLMILEEANQKLDNADDNALEYRNQLCENLEIYGTSITNEALIDFGGDFNMVDVLIAREVLLIFEDTLSKLSNEAADALIGIRDNMNSSSSNNIDWRKYAEISPEQMREKIISTCQ